VRILIRILFTILITFGFVFLCVRWVGPVALSFYAARKALPVTRIVPTNLDDQSVSESPGATLARFGYEFEIPWTDLDESKTKLYPENKPTKTMGVLTFHSGLRLIIVSIPPREMVQEFTKGDFHMSPGQVDALFGPGASTSDYVFMKNLYEFTPAKMHFWSLSPGVHFSEQMVLMIKSIVPAKAAETGIFNLQNQIYKGFQQGSPRARPESLLLDLYSDDGGVEIRFVQKDYHNSGGVTQAEINRIVQTVHKVPGRDAALAQTGPR